MRRATHESFNPRSVEKYQHVQALNTAQTVSRILRRPEEWKEDIALYGVIFMQPDIDLILVMLCHIASQHHQY